MNLPTIGSLVLAIGLVGCAANAPVPSGFPAYRTEADLQFSCGIGHPFAASLFDTTQNAEKASTPAAAALRDHLRISPEPGFLPDTGWFLAGSDTESATFVARDASGQGFVVVTVASKPLGWTVGGYGSCRPSVLLGSFGNAEWELDPEAAVPGPRDTRFTALVTEMSCASGRSSEGRITAPLIFYESDEILVIFGVRNLTGIQTCPSNPSTKVTVDLAEPIGDRQLLDGSFLPPHDPSGPLT